MLYSALIDFHISFSQTIIDRGSIMLWLKSTSVNYDLAEVTTEAYKCTIQCSNHGFYCLTDVENCVVGH